jgi:phosphonate transport system ATP-binding protein
MRILVELAHERGTPALVNMHDDGLAQAFADRVIGLRGGEIVFDGPADRVTANVLTDIYGEEDWSTTIRKVEGEAAKPGKGSSDGKDSLVRESLA